SCSPLSAFLPSFFFYLDRRGWPGCWGRPAPPRGVPPTGVIPPGWYPWGNPPGSISCCFPLQLGQQSRHHVPHRGTARVVVVLARLDDLAVGRQPIAA